MGVRREIQFCISYLLRHEVGDGVVALLGEEDGEHGVRARRRLVHVRRCHGPGDNTRFRGHGDWGHDLLYY